jgi:LysR family glycine cleavage system transcriptional activator
MTAIGPPSWPALRAFAAAARRGSFRAAASELGVTPSAISHQISALETSIGAALFIRAPRQVALTAAGARLAADIGAALADIDAAVERARNAAADTRLRITALPLFTSFWLMPRLSRFEAAHPDASIEIDTSNRVADLGRDNFGVAIRNAEPGGEGLAARKLLDLRARPLCAASLAEDLSAPTDLARTTLIHISAGRAGWTDWLRQNGLEGLKPRANLTVDTLPTAIAAAAEGRGVMLGLEPIIWDAPAAAALVAPFDTPPAGAGAYFVVWRKQDAKRPLVRDFVAWIVEEMRRDKRRLSAYALKARRKSR